MRVLVLGAGGIGGYFGGRLVEAGADVTFLLRATRGRKIAEAGLRIESPVGDARLEPKVATSAEGPADLVLLSCKAYDLDEAIAAIRPAVGERTIILPLLNGLAHLDVLDATFGPERVVGGTAHGSFSLAANGTILHHNKLEAIIFGERQATTDLTATSPRCEAIAALLGTATFKAVPSKSIMLDMWEKFAFLTAISAITTLMRADVGTILASENGERLANAMLDECEAVAAAAGFPTRAKMHATGRGLLTERGSSLKASMLRDIETGNQVEADHIQGDMIRRAEALGVETDLLKVAHCHLQAYQHTRTRA